MLLSSIIHEVLGIRLGVLARLAAFSRSLDGCLGVCSSSPFEAALAAKATSELGVQATVDAEERSLVITQPALQVPGTDG